MMSKNSFWASIRENNKRRIWLWAVSALFWFFYYPVGMAMIMSRKKNHNIMDNLTGELAKIRLVDAAETWVSTVGPVAVFVVMMAVICAIQGFSYLYSRKKVDLYHSVPVKKSRRFAVIYLNGVAIYFIPYLVNLLLALAVAAVNGGMSGRVAGTAVVSVGMNLLLYLGIYGLTLLAVMLTGNLMITLFATAIFLGYELVVRWVFYGFHMAYFDYFSSRTVDMEPVLSPIGQYAKLIARAGTFGEKIKGAPWAVVLLLLMAVGFGAAAYFAYQKRPAEAAGKTMAFTWTKPVVKILLVIPMAMAVGLTVRDIVGRNNSTTLVIFGMAAAVVVSSSIIEVIYERDIRAAFKKKRQMLFSGACMAAIYCIFVFDLAGYDAWIPKTEKMENGIVIISRDTYRNNFVNTDLQYENMIDHLMGMKLTDVEAVKELFEKRVDDDVLREDGENRDVLSLEVGCRMKNGKVKWRSFAVSQEEEELLNKIIGSQEYKECVYQLYDDEFYQGVKDYEVEEIRFSTGLAVENIAPEDFEKLRELYVKDMEQADYSTYRDEFVCGSVEIWLKKNVNHSQMFEYDVYPSFSNTLAYLKEKGLYNGNVVEADEVTSITVTNYHYDLIEKGIPMDVADAEQNLAAASLAEDAIVTKTYTEKAQIEEILNAAYSVEFPEYWKGQDTFDENYSVTVQMKNGSTDSKYYRGINEFILIADRIPEWLEKETAYK